MVNTSLVKSTHIPRPPPPTFGLAPDQLFVFSLQAALEWPEGGDACSLPWPPCQVAVPHANLSWGLRGPPGPAPQPERPPQDSPALLSCPCRPQKPPFWGQTPQVCPGLKVASLRAHQALLSEEGVRNLPWRSQLKG